MMSTIPRTLRRVCFMLMQFIGITLFSFGIAAHNKEAPLLRIGTLDVWLVLASFLVIWSLFAVGFLGITLHYARTHPFWALLHLLIVLLMVAFFITYLRFEPLDVSFWGPLAVDLGLVVSTGFEAIYNSADRGLLRHSYEFVMGMDDHNGNADNGTVNAHNNSSATSHELTDLPTSSQPHTSNV